jgi:hypothetical protein
MTTAPSKSRREKFARTLRETKRGRTWFVISFFAICAWLPEFVLWIRDLLLSGKDAHDREFVLSGSYDSDEALEVTSRATFYVSRDWWSIAIALSILALCIWAVRFLEPVRRKRICHELGLRGGGFTTWKWIACLALLPALIWIGFVLLVSEPAHTAEPFTWKEYFFPFPGDGPHCVDSVFLQNDSARPVWWLRAGLSSLAAQVFLYGFAWRQLRRAGTRFWPTSLLLIALGAVADIVSQLVIFAEQGLPPFDVIGTHLILTAVFSLHIPLSGWIVERWGGSIWPLAIAHLAPWLPEVLLDTRYDRFPFSRELEYGLPAFLGLALWYSLPLILLALLTLRKTHTGARLRNRRERTDPR